MQEGIPPDGHVRVTPIYKLPPREQAVMFNSIISGDAYFWAKITAGIIIGFVLGFVIAKVF